MSFLSPAYNDVQAVLLADVTQAPGNPGLLLPDGWKPGRVYEAMLGEPSRCLRLLHVLKRGDDYAGVAFERIPAPQL